MDETKLVAVILASQAIMVTVPTEGDPTRTVVDLYERILAELRARDREAEAVAVPQRRRA